jgi:hypothetical protein
MREEAINNIARTLEARRRLYELAHVSYDTTGKSVDETVPALLGLLPKAIRHSGTSRIEDSAVWGRP